MGLELLDQVFALDTLPANEKALLVFLAHKAHKDGSSIYPGIETICLAVCHKRCQTLRLLRRLKEKGYIIQINNAGGPRNVALFHIPLNQAGMIDPRPVDMPHKTRYKKPPALAHVNVDESTHKDEIGEFWGDNPPSPPQPSEEVQAPSRDSPPISQAIVPLNIAAAEKAQREAEREEREEQIRLWTEKYNYFTLQRNRQRVGTKGWERWNKLAVEAEYQIDLWRKYVPAQISVRVEEATGEYGT